MLNRTLLFTSAAIVFAACGPLPDSTTAEPAPASSSEEAAPTDPTGAARAEPVLRLLLTDAPLDGVDQVNVTFDAVEVHGDSSGWVTVTSSVQTYDLLGLQDGVTADLGLTTLSTGAYSQIRMHLTDAWLVIDGEDVDLFVPSGEQSGLKILHDFTVAEGTETTLVVDFDAGASIHQRGNGGWIMRPVIKVVGTSTAALDDGAPEGGSGTTTTPSQVPDDSGDPEDPSTGI